MSHNSISAKVEFFNLGSNKDYCPFYTKVNPKSPIYCTADTQNQNAYVDTYVCDMTTTFHIVKG